jgi:hypothetical protein
MRASLVFLVFGLLISQALSQTTDNQSVIGDKWRLVIGSSIVYQLTITEVAKIGKESFYSASSNDGRASLIALAGVKNDGSLSNVIAFISKSKPPSVRIQPDAINDEEGTFCMTPYSSDKKLPEGFYFNGFFSRIGTFRSPADADGKCTLEKL